MQERGLCVWWWILLLAYRLVATRHCRQSADPWFPARRIPRLGGRRAQPWKRGSDTDGIGRVREHPLVRPEPRQQQNDRLAERAGRVRVDGESDASWLEEAVVDAGVRDERHEEEVSRSLPADDTREVLQCCDHGDGVCRRDSKTARRARCCERSGRRSTQDDGELHAELKARH